jgi:death-on-curing protein
MSGERSISPRFLTLDEVLEIHEDQISRYGGAAEILSLPLLESALAQPQSTFDGQYLLADLYQMAASYLFHIVRNHPFADGNKRVGAVAAIVFLMLNDVDPRISNEQLESITLQVAAGHANRDDVADLLRHPMA